MSEKEVRALIRRAFTELDARPRSSVELTLRRAVVPLVFGTGLFVAACDDDDTYDPDPPPYGAVGAYGAQGGSGGAEGGSGGATGGSGGSGATGGTGGATGGTGGAPGGAGGAPGGSGGAPGGASG